MPPHSPARRPWHLTPWLLLALAVGAFLFFENGRVADGDAPRRHTRYLNVQGDGPSARAWYDGAPPTGVPLQEALTKFSEEGYSTVKVTDPYVGNSGNVVWGLLMERGR